MSENEKNSDCCGKNACHGDFQNRGKKMHEKHESKEETQSKTSVNSWVLVGLGILFVLGALQTFQLSSTLMALNTQAAQAGLSAAQNPLSGTPATAPPSNSPNPGGVADITQGLPSQVGGC